MDPCSWSHAEVDSQRCTGVDEVAGFKNHGSALERRDREPVERHETKIVVGSSEVRQVEGLGRPRAAFFGHTTRAGQRTHLRRSRERRG